MVLDMENSRRPFARSRDPGPIKKPKLAEESVRPPNPTSRPFPAQRPIGAVAAPASRYRASGRETENNNDPSREAYQPQPINPHHELVNQYRSALSELTFNSKPVITNLTIIAGESLHASKAIAATICNNILEVPSEQKLPSLYLLDSIVKNIGRDYIKHFATRLPEVFIKAYRQVDPSTHSSMRHLFGTWKGVFHPQTLQMIEKELGFASKSDGSSSMFATSRTDPQPQRPPQSIHVNPKYLERQRLQQSTRAKGMVDDVPGLIASSPGDADRMERTSGITAKATWTGPSAKLNSIQQSQRGSLSVPLYEKDIGAISGGYKYGSDLSQNSRLGIKKIGGMIAEEGREKPWYGARSSAPETISGPRDELNTKNRISNYSTARLANADLSGASRSTIGMSNSWKNSEEEEFMWDMHSRLSENDLANISSDSRNDLWTPDESEKLEPENHLLRPPRVQDVGSRFDSETSVDSYSSEQKEQTANGCSASSARPSHDDFTRPGFSLRNSEGYPSTISGLPSISASTTLTRKGTQPQVASSHVGASGSVILPNSASGSARQTPVNHLTSLQNRANQDLKKSDSLPHRDPRATKIAGMPHRISRNFGSPSTAENASVLSNPLASEVSRESNTSSLLAAVINSGILSDTLISGGKKVESFEGEEKPMSPSSSVHHSLPCSGPSILSTHDNISAQTKVEHPLGLPPSSASVTAATQTPDGTNKASDPIANLLNSLVSKGLISASKTESSSLSQPKMPSTVQGQSPDNSTNGSVSISAVLPDVQSVPCVDKGPVPASKAEGSATPSEPTKVEAENLIGFQFRSDVIREFHPSVVSSLFDDLPHQCSSCGSHLKHKEQLDTHSELHAAKKKIESTNAGRQSLVWFPKAEEWLNGKPCQWEPEPANYALDESERGTENEPMVPAEENQYACILCGELFEDYFSQENDRWMFKGTVYMAIPSANIDAKGPIVHANCLTESTVHDLGFASGIKQEMDV